VDGAVGAACAGSGGRARARARARVGAGAGEGEGEGNRSDNERGQYASDRFVFQVTNTYVVPRSGVVASGVVLSGSARCYPPPWQPHGAVLSGSARYLFQTEVCVQGILLRFTMLCDVISAAAEFMVWVLRTVAYGEHC
jgi:hypothetical protein